MMGRLVVLLPQRSWARLRLCFCVASSVMSFYTKKSFFCLHQSQPAEQQYRTQGCGAVAACAEVSDFNSARRACDWPMRSVICPVTRSRACAANSGTDARRRLGQHTTRHYRREHVLFEVGGGLKIEMHTIIPLLYFDFTFS